MKENDKTTVYFTHMTNAEATVLENIWRQNVRKAQLEFLTTSLGNTISSDMIQKIAEHLKKPVVVDARKHNDKEYILESIKFVDQ